MMMMARKGQRTRDEILETAIGEASRIGLEGLSIGALAKDVGMSKSGLFAHFGSKEQLQVAVLQRSRDLFADAIIRPAVRLPRGLPRLRALFDNWLAWTTSGVMPGGCLFTASAWEMDDREGPVRDELVESLGSWMRTLEKAAAICVEEGDLHGDLDPSQLAFELFGVMQAYHVYSHLFRGPRADQRARSAFESLISANAP